MASGVATLPRMRNHLVVERIEQPEVTQYVQII